jgi:hypothetical protein
MVGVRRTRDLALMSVPTTPTTSNDSSGGSSRQDSTQPSSLASVSSGQENILKPEVQDEQSVGEVGEEDTVGNEEDPEGMDIKARALTNLLKTSSVHILSPPVISLRLLTLSSCRFLWRLWPKK